MISISDIPVKYKLILMQVFTSVIILAFCTIAFIITDVRSHKGRISDSRIAISQVIGSNSISAIQFLDNQSAHKNLMELSIIPDVINAAIYDGAGNIFASYTKEGAEPLYFLPEESGKIEGEIKNSYLFIHNPIEKDKKILGTVYMQVELSELEKVKKEKYQIAGLTLFLGIILSFVIAMLVQRNISKPVYSLVKAMQQVKESGDYRSRVKVYGKDEINMLSMVFNDMLEKIEKRELSIKERTAELEAANQELESFSYSVSHDLRAPIRAISGFTNIIALEYNEKFDEEGKDLLKTITGEAKRMGQLIDDLLAFSRLGRREIEKSDFDMEALVKSVVAEVLKLNENPLVEFDIKNILPGRGDPALLRQVWINLISNAIKFSQHSKNPKIEIGSYSDKDAVVYYVRDNGVGFDMKYYDKLFGVFQRLHGNEEFEGTGIGLAIIKRTVTRHGGKVWAESKLDEGATFYFSLPA